MTARFSNQDPEHRPGDVWRFLRWRLRERLTGAGSRRPAGPAVGRRPADLAAISSRSGIRLTWIGHASFLASFNATHLLADPVFSDRIGGWVRRHCPPGLTPNVLPPLAAALVTHAHYDHFDRPSICALPRETPIVVPRELGRWVRRWGRSAIELDWWESVRIADATVTLVPARHWSRRLFHGVNETLWGGYVIECGGVAIYHAGDSGWFAGFAEIGRRFPGLLAALLPIGAYTPAWFMEHHHINPEQAGEAFLAVGARHLVPMHWGTFKLTDEPLLEPVERLRQWWRNEQPAGKELNVMEVGETISLVGATHGTD